MKVTVTGATGYIGRHVIQALLNRGIEVLATASNISRARAMSWFSSVEFVPLDLSTPAPADLFGMLGAPDRLIHLAWPGLPNYGSDFHVNTALPLQKSFLQSLVNGGLQNLTVAGTCFEYGLIEGRLDETLDVMPANPYAQAKHELQRFIGTTLAQAHPGFSWKWARLFYSYGSGQSENSLFSQLDKAIDTNAGVFKMSPGDQLRDFLPVEEMAARLVSIALQDRVSGIINCCSGIPVTVSELVESYIEEKKASIILEKGFYPYSQFEPRNFWGDTDKLNKILHNE